MPKKESRSLRTAFRNFGLSKQERSKRENDGDRQDGQPVVPAILSKSTAGSFVTDAVISQTAEDELPSTTTQPTSQKTTPSRNLAATSARESATRYSAEYPPPATTINPSVRDTNYAQKKSSLPIPPEQLWDQAYDELKRDEPKLFELYESILSRELDSSNGAKGNVIEPDPEMRPSQMDSLLNTGLDKTAKLIRIEKNIGDAINIVLSVKEAVGNALQAFPIAALAWAGVCVALQASCSSTFCNSARAVLGGNRRDHKVQEQ